MSENIDKKLQQIIDLEIREYMKGEWELQDILSPNQ